ncbi:MAG: DUF2071 domain-containing protein [Planctomycetota bacterium]
MTATTTQPPAIAPEPHAPPPWTDRTDIPGRALQPTLSMAGTLDRCVLLSFRTPADSVQHLLPPGLELMRRGPYAFWNIVLCHVRKMRPVGVPEALGMSYHHIAYRLRVQAMTDRADTRQGLYFVRSDADASLLGAVGNRLSDFNFHRAAVDWQTQRHTERIDVTTADGNANASLVFTRTPPATHPADSCFPTAADARAALKYEPLGLAVNERGQLKLAEVFRDETQWREDVIDVTETRFEFFGRVGQSDAKLELATQVSPLPYRWRLGRRERLLTPPTPELDTPTQPLAQTQTPDATQRRQPAIAKPHTTPPVALA